MPEITRLVGYNGFAGVIEYFSDMWNVIDWVNFVLYGLTYIQILKIEDQLRDGPDCSSY